MNRTDRIRQAAHRAQVGIEAMHETPREPTPAEAAYLKAIELFELGSIHDACDKLAEGDRLRAEANAAARPALLAEAERLEALGRAAFHRDQNAPETLALMEQCRAAWAAVPAPR